MGDIHSVWGWVAVGVCGLAGIFGITLAAIHRPPGRVFQAALATAVGVVIVQVLLGLGSMNFEHKNPGNQHVFYGVVISFTLGFAYIYRAQFRKRPALYFGLLLLFLMGLGIRGIMTFGHSFLTATHLGAPSRGDQLLLQGKKLLVTGITTDDSIAFHVARVAQEEGAELVVTNFGRGLRLTERAVQRLPEPVPVLEMDITDEAHVATVIEDLGGRWGKIDGAVHAIAFAPGDALGGNFLNTPASSAGTAFLTSAFSFKTLATATLPLLQKAGGGSLVALDFDNRMAWPAYDWMGVAKSALQSVCRYLARDLGEYGIRANLVSAGPLKTVAAKSIPGFEILHDIWNDRAPLAWDSSNPEPVARMVCVLLSDWAPMTTGEVIHVDGGFHAIAAPAKSG